MKIIVTSTKKKGKTKTYQVDVVDGERILHTEVVEGVMRRDELVWKLAELYNALDIDMKETAATEEFMFAEIPTIPVLEEEEADEYFESNKEVVYNRILQAVGEGIISERENIRLFELNGTGVYITSNREDWSVGVQQALDYFVSVEQYDKCIAARQLLQDLQ